MFSGIWRETLRVFYVYWFRKSDCNPSPDNTGIYSTGYHENVRSLGRLWRHKIMGYNHLTVNHTYEFVDPFTGAHTENVENSWTPYLNKKQHGTHRTIFDSYLCECSHRKLAKLYTTLVKLRITVPRLQPSNFLSMQGSWFVMWNPRKNYKHFVRVGAFVLEEVGIFHISQFHLQDEVLLYC